MTEFADKIKTLQIMGRSNQGSRVDERKDASGQIIKQTREGDPDAGYVTHTEYSRSDRVDANVAPARMALQLKNQAKG